jgi:hypothetical protein
MPTAGPRIVEWFRADPWPRIRRVLFTGPLLLTFGGIIVAVSLVTRQSTAIRIDAAIAGFALVAGGALVTMLGMQRILREDVCLSLRTDGVSIQSSGREVLVKWDELEGARWDGERRELVLDRKGASPIAIQASFGAIDGPTLARRIEGTQRKSAMNLLR